MNEIRYEQTSRTFGVAVMAGVLAANLSLSIPQQFLNGPERQRLLTGSYFQSNSNSTFDRHSNPWTGSYSVNSYSLEKSVSNFYARLLTDQERLGSEFEKVLHDNLWDLYES